MKMPWHRRGSDTGIDVLIPTCGRPAALAVTLTALAAQTFGEFRALISDQTEVGEAANVGEVRAALRVLGARGRPARIVKHLPRRGMAEQRDFLLSQAKAPYVLFLDDDLVLEPDVLGRMHAALRDARCGFIGCAPIGLSYVGDVRPEEQTVEFWEGPVRPEVVLPHTPQWDRHRLHNAANIYHVQRRLGINDWPGRLYRVAWVGGCVLFDAEKLRESGGYAFWRRLPKEHSGEDVLAQIRLMAQHGGAGLMPSGVYHQELPSTVTDRQVEASKALPQLLPSREQERWQARGGI